ncbi:MAG TPA: type II toxin-antitoxin system HicB family antitoxin [Thermomicrobiales bacterium]|nr:type II toxin-antitoxin system HicB family antitoxin [Thermomicrobiales bacterium]
MLTDYIAAAMRHMACEQLPDDDTWYCEIPDLPGVWSNAPTLDEAHAELQDVLEAWIALGLARHEAIPAIDGVEIAVQAV